MPGIVWSTIPGISLPNKSHIRKKDVGFDYGSFSFQQTGAVKEVQILINMDHFLGCNIHGRFLFINRLSCTSLLVNLHQQAQQFIRQNLSRSGGELTGIAAVTAMGKRFDGRHIAIAGTVGITTNIGKFKR